MTPVKELRRRFLWCGLVVLFFPCILLAQQAADLEQGLKPYGTYHGGNLDSVSMTNGNLTLHIPLTSYAQRGRISTDEFLVYNAKNYTEQKSCYGWETPVGSDPSELQPPGHPGCNNYVMRNGGDFGVTLHTVNDAMVVVTFPVVSMASDYATYEKLFTVTTADGSSHQLGYLGSAASLGFSGAGSVYRAVDGSGWMFQDNEPEGAMIDEGGSGTLWFPNGNRAPSGADWDAEGEGESATLQYVTDPDGNYTDANGDTVGRTTSVVFESNPTAVCPNINAPYQAISYAQTKTYTDGSKITFCYATVNVRTHFLLTDQYDFEWIGPVNMLQSVLLQDRVSYWAFIYDSVNPNETNTSAADYYAYGELTKVILPTGGSISYTWGAEPNCQPRSEVKPSGELPPQNHYVMTRTVDPADGSSPQTWTYNWFALSGSQGTGHITVNPQVAGDSAANETVHWINEAAGTCSLFETETDTYQGSHSSGTLLSSVVKDFQWQLSALDTTSQTAADVYQDWETESFNGGSPKKTTWTYNNQLNYGQRQIFYQAGYSPVWQGTNLNATFHIQEPSSVAEYDFGATSPMRTTNYTYQWQSDGRYMNGNNLLATPTSTIVYDINSNPVSATYNTYDEAAKFVGYSGTTTHFGNPPGAVFGHATTSTHWLNTGTSPVTQTYWYNTGEVQSVIDPGQHTTTHSYNSAYYGAFVTQTCQPQTNGVNHCVSGSYDLNKGVLASFTDENSQTTTYTHDNMLRITSAVFPDTDANGIHGETDFSYYPTVAFRSAQRAQRQNASTWLYDYAYFDGLGRTTQTRHADPEGDDYVNTSYDALGRVYSVSNPYRSGVSSPTDGTTYTNYDALGRTTLVTKQDGNTVPTSYWGNLTTETDETGRQKQRVNDALGRLTEVIEPNPTTGSLTSGSYPTYYYYDPLGNLTYVNQVGDSSAPRTRSFSYDSLSRLLSAYNPETGTVNYSYAADASCNPGGEELRSKTDNRGISTTYCYDQLHRLTLKTYSDGNTAPNWFYYDETSIWGVNPQNPIGRLSHSAGSGGVDSTVFSYDAIGRIAEEWPCTPSICGQGSYPFFVAYDLAGHQTSLTYPSGRKIIQSYNSAGHLLNVNFASFNGTAVNYTYFTAYQSPSNPGYDPVGNLRLYYYGNNVWSSESYNSRLQPSFFLSQGSVTGTPYYLIRQYSYNESAFGNHDAGNVATITDTLNGAHSQNYNYDYLNRIASGYQNDNSFNQTFSPDPWGNLKQSGTAAFNPNFSSNNQISQTGYNYDAAGNVLSDTLHNYAYDAESRIKSVDATVSYTYDADGNRVRKDVSGSDPTEYIYFNGEPIAEHDPNTGDWSDYIFANGKRVAEGTNYFHEIDIGGTNSTNTQVSSFVFSSPGTLIGYTIRNGDKLYFWQYAWAGTLTGLRVIFSDGTDTNWSVRDQDGNYLNQAPSVGTRIVDLSGFAGKQVSSLHVISEAGTAAGAWGASFHDIALVNSDGSVISIYDGQAANPLTFEWTSGATNVSSVVGLWEGRYDPNYSTFYYHEDHLGTSRLMTGTQGYPVWQGTFLPYGQEWNPQLTTNHYKFTGKERDTESNLDYFGARYYSSTMGRWMSPDWADKPEAVPYADLSDPQSLNLYGYVRNNPMSKADPDGHCCDLSDVADFLTGASNAYGSDNLLGAGRMDQNTAAGKIGAAFGDAAATIQGAGEFLGGAGVEGGGILLDATGVGALVGVPANLAGAAMMAHGGATTVVGGANLIKDANVTDGTKPYQDTPENQERMQQGKPPVGNDGNPVELHHDGQTTNSPTKEMTRTDHRLGENFKKNHTNTGQKPSQVDRNQTAKDRREHWKNKTDQSQ